MRQLALLENLPLDSNNKELVGINWKELYLRVKERGIRELLFHDNSTLVRIAYEAENYDIHTIEQALLRMIENNNLELFELVYTEKYDIDYKIVGRLLKKSMIEKNHKSFIIALGDPDDVVIETEEVLKLISQYGDADFFDTYVQHLAFETPTQMIESLCDKKFLSHLVEFNNISIINNILKIMSSIDTKFPMVWSGLMYRAIEMNNFEIIEILISYKNLYGDDYYINILKNATSHGNYVLVKKFIDMTNDPEILSSVRTIQTVINKIKIVDISIEDDHQQNILDQLLMDRDLNILE
jgi:hypothetical protein